MKEGFPQIIRRIIQVYVITEKADKWSEMNGKQRESLKSL